MNKAKLKEQIEKSLEEIENQIFRLQIQADEFGISIYTFKYTNGELVMPGLIIAKAQLLLALTEFVWDNNEPRL